MTETTPRLALPLLAAGQAQKELFHNEALALLDAVALAVAAPPQDDPPIGAGNGTVWIVGTGPGGEWSGWGNHLAIRIGGGWRFVVPSPGMTLGLVDGRDARWDGTVWNLGKVIADAVLVGGVAVIGAQRPAIADPSGGSVIDVESRSALATILGALRDHGLIAT